MEDDNLFFDDEDQVFESYEDNDTELVIRHAFQEENLVIICLEDGNYKTISLNTPEKAKMFIDLIKNV